MHEPSPACRDSAAVADLRAANGTSYWCDRVSGIASRLCQGVAALWAASCGELASEAFLRAAVQQVGLVQDSIQGGERLYGDNARYMLNNSGKAGLWQEPLQISSALRHLATSDLIPRPITSYIELGVHTAWTCAFVAAFLARLAWPTAFHGAAIDITKMRISQGATEVLGKLNVSFVYRGHLWRWLEEAMGVRPTGPHHESLPAAGSGATPPSPTAIRHESRHTHESPRPLVDLCFIDANHSFDAVLADYLSLSPHCRLVMLHDIQDQRTVELQRRRHGGGVPSVWHALSMGIHPSRLAAFTAQRSVHAPAFGIGIIAPHAERGTAVPDDHSAIERWGRGEEAWRHLCGAAPSLCRRAWLAAMRGSLPTAADSDLRAVLSAEFTPMRRS